MSQKLTVALRKIIDPIMGFSAFTFLMVFGLLSHVFILSSLISWGWSAFSFLKFGNWESPVEPYIKNNFKPHFDIEWVGISQFVQWIIDVIYQPVSRFVTGVILEEIFLIWLLIWDKKVAA